MGYPKTCDDAIGWAAKPMEDNDFVHPEELYDMCWKVVLDLLLERVQDTTPSYSMEVLTSEKGDPCES